MAGRRRSRLPCSAPISNSIGRTAGYTSFDQFLGELSSSKRKNLRKERAAVFAEACEFDWLTGSDLTEAIGISSSSSTWIPAAQMGPALSHARVLQPRRRSMGEQVLLILAKRAGRYDRRRAQLLRRRRAVRPNWGCSEFIPFLHFETCYYQAIEFAIARGLSGSKPAHRASTSCCAATFRCRPTAPTTSRMRACAAPSTTT